MTGRRLTSLVLLTAAVLVLAGAAGCGQSESEEYAERVEEARDLAADEARNVAGEIAAQPDTDAMAQTLGEIESRLDGAAADLEALDVPEGASEVNADHVAAIEDFSAAVKEARRTAAEGQRVWFRKATTDLLRAASTLNSELSAIQSEAQQAGIPIDPVQSRE